MSNNLQPMTPQAGLLVFDKIYPGQEPTHVAPPLHFAVGGQDPLDGVSIYKSAKQTDHFYK